MEPASASISVPCDVTKGNFPEFCDFVHTFRKVKRATEVEAGICFFSDKSIDSLETQIIDLKVKKNNLETGTSKSLNTAG